MNFIFDKYQGTGNDFIILDNRSLEFPKEDASMISSFCNRNLGIGADGLILLENEDKVDFRMVYFNADGRESSMCGNGGRCIVHYAKRQNIIKDKATFIAIDGIHHATIKGDDVSISMKDVSNIETSEDYAYLNTGSPHYILWSKNLSTLNIIEKAREIRYNQRFTKEGTNVNFLNFSNGVLEMRTYERGVEDETLSCGTGMVAAALIAFLAGKIQGNSDCVIKTKGGNTAVSFKHIGEDEFRDIKLLGPAKFVFSGVIDV